MKLLYVAVCSISAISCVQVQEFLDDRLEDFMARVVPQAERQSFRDYYQKYMGSIKALKNPNKREQQLIAIRQKAKSALEVKHPEWSNALQPYEFYERTPLSLSQVNPKQVRIFLTRVGVWEEYQKDTAGHKASMWQRVKSYSKTMTKKVAGVFKRNKKEKEVVA